MYQLMDQLPYERALIGVYSAALMERAVALTVDWCKQRQVFGKPLIELQNTRFQLAEASTRTEVARVFVYDVIRRLIDGSLDGTTASMAKWWVTQTYGEVVDACLQLFGGAGYMFLVETDFVTGETIRVDGGRHLK